MRIDGGRAKKLTVAFQFQFSNQAAWKCDQCRRQGLEKQRRCGWTPGAREGARRVVWARGRAATEECPKSYVTAESLEWMERYWAWKAFGGGDVMTMPARQVDAFSVLEQEWHAEQRAE